VNIKNIKSKRCGVLGLKAGVMSAAGAER
jgi:hypothetical protein